MSLKKALITSMCLALLPVAAFAQSGPVHTAEIFQGEISITQDSAFDLVVHVDRSSKLAGEVVTDQVFVFRSEIPLPTDVANLDGPGRIVVRPDAVFFFADDHPALILRTGPAELAPSTGAFDGLVLNGYQLSRYQSTSQDYLEGAIEGQQLERPAGSLRPRSDSGLRASGAAALLEVDDDDCTAGGPGSSTCEISGPSGSCDAECNDGYDACCNEGSCGCEPAAN